MNIITSVRNAILGEPKDNEYYKRNMRDPGFDGADNSVHQEHQLARTEKAQEAANKGVLSNVSDTLGKLKFWGGRRPKKPTKKKPKKQTKKQTKNKRK